LSATSLPRVTPDLALPAVCRPDRSIALSPTSSLSTGLPRPGRGHSSLPTIFFRPLPLRVPKSRRINTCKSLSKQTTLTLFRNIDLQKTWGGGGVMTNQTCPEACRFTGHGTRHLASLRVAQPIRATALARRTGHGLRNTLSVLLRRILLDFTYCVPHSVWGTRYATR